MDSSRFTKSLSQFHVTNTNQSTIMKLKRFHVLYDHRICKLIQDCDQQSAYRQSNYKELEEISRHLGKLSNRWKRLTSLIVESLLELDHETLIAHEEFEKIRKKQQNLENLTEKNQEEISNMSNLIALIQHFIGKAENRHLQDPNYSGAEFASTSNMKSRETGRETRLKSATAYPSLTVKQRNLSEPSHSHHNRSQNQTI